MKGFIKTIQTLFKRDDMKPTPVVRKKDEVTDPVYHFFFKEKAAERKRAFDRALKAAEEDQKEIIRKYETIRKELQSA